MGYWIGLPLDDGRSMPLSEGDVRTVRLTDGEILEAVWGELHGCRCFFRRDDDGEPIGDGLDVDAVQSVERPGASIPEAERRARGQRELHLRIDQETVTRIGELCDDAGPGTTRASVIQALVARAHGTMLRGRKRKHA